MLDLAAIDYGTRGNGWHKRKWAAQKHMEGIRANERQNMASPEGFHSARLQIQERARVPRRDVEARARGK